MHFEYHKKSGEKIDEAKKSGFFSLGDLSDESVLARYYISRYFHDTYSFIPFLDKDRNGFPLPIISGSLGTFYWSISHSDEYVAWMIDKNPCGIDIAQYFIRDESLLSKHDEEEYEILGEKSWKNFYRLWTSKEALIKKLSLTLDDMEKIKLFSSDKEQLVFVFFSESHTITTIQEDKIFISFTPSYESI
ncbi:MAG: hypothetical protein HHAS10_08430 [Candidatus Altimarinota bacterium]